LFSWTLHAIVYFWLMPAYIAFYTMVPRAAGGRLYSDTMGRLTFIFFLIYSLPVGLHHLLMDPEHGNGLKFIQVLLTAFVTAPTFDLANTERGHRVFRIVSALAGSTVALLVLGYLAIYLLIFLPRGIVG
jgi:heme/copper-type cytochrome/quinol oxidase subunit 1